MHKSAFGLNSVRHLRLMTAEAMRGAPNFHAVTFRQAFGRALSADGVVTVAVVKAKRGWKVVYASSSLTPDAALTGKQKLSPLSAWLQAARAAGIHVQRRDASVLGKTADGALAISALGVSGQETVRPIAFGTPHHGALRAYDTTVTRSIQGDQNSYRVIVDAATGRLLYRQNQVFNLADNPTWKGFQMRAALQPAERVPVELPEHGHARHVLLDRDRGLHDRRRGQPGDHIYPRRRRLEAAVGRAGHGRGLHGDGQHDVGQQRRRRARLERRRHGVVRQPGARPRHRARPATTSRPGRTPGTRRSATRSNVNAAINPTGNDIEASTASMFVGHNRMHDFSYYLGFDEGHWNAQQYNNGVTTVDPTPPPGGPVPRRSATTA